MQPSACGHDVATPLTVPVQDGALGSYLTTEITTMELPASSRSLVASNGGGDDDDDALVQLDVTVDVAALPVAADRAAAVWIVHVHVVHHPVFNVPSLFLRVFTEGTCHALFARFVRVVPCLE